MPLKGFYTSLEYKEKQRKRSKAAWQRGAFAFLTKKETKKCLRPGCGVLFEVVPSNPKKFCSSRCAAKVNNLARGAHLPETKLKIAQSLIGTVSPYRGVIKVRRVNVQCQHADCKKKFLKERWKKTRFCSNACSMHVIGSRPTSPKAARAKAGVRIDINPPTYFYSRWEANMARLFNHFRIKWIHQPASFDLGGQIYTPDFFLPDYDMYIEIKNFLGEYSKERDRKFRERYPEICLRLLLRDAYYALEKKYSILIPNWEYKNSKFIISADR